MNKEKKISYLEKMVKTLSSSLEKLKKENYVLISENGILRESLANLRENYEILEMQMIQNRDDYILKARELSKSKDRYDRATASLLLTKKDFEKKMNVLIKNIQKKT